MTYDPKRTRRATPPTDPEAAADAAPVDALLGPVDDTEPEGEPASAVPEGEPTSIEPGGEPTSIEPGGERTGIEPGGEPTSAVPEPGPTHRPAPGIATPHAVEAFVARSVWRPVLAALVALVVLTWLVRRRRG
ncbi:MAG TPA: hypothetical protein VK866_08590 [Acidimicrobiales bacterium]|nr:hypothetical protein [Acidimicrobiales bacterium]